ncbi:hypothetical protein [Salininema proteolyticum]|uniref:Uncharacterized protein n=1 Tax=Salininema proteolyticum TaxID=1607685 RepID=A0ABV8TVQ5_9ACTN
MKRPVIRKTATALATATAGVAASLLLAGSAAAFSPSASSPAAADGPSAATSDVGAQAHLAGPFGSKSDCRYNEGVTAGKGYTIVMSCSQMSGGWYFSFR